MEFQYLIYKVDTCANAPIQITGHALLQRRALIAKGVS